MKIAKLFLLFISGSMLFFACNNTSEAEEDTMKEDQMEQADPSVTMLWKTDTTFTGSESVLYHKDKNVIYVSCGNTKSGEKDGDGFIAVLNPDGSVKNMDWTTGLNAPKGMAIVGNSLYVTDIDEIVQIDLSSGEVTKKYPVQGAEFLNDAATDGSYVYFSDMRQAKVYRLADGEYEMIAENVPSINGLESYSGTLYGLNKEGLIKFDDNGGYDIITDEVQGGDGLVILDDDTFIASRWAGEIYFIDGDQVTKIVDTSPEKSNTADISYIPDEKVIIVPTFLKNEVAAYQLDMGSGN